MERVLYLRIDENTYWKLQEKAAINRLKNAQSFVLNLIKKAIEPEILLHDYSEKEIKTILDEDAKTAPILIEKALRTLKKEKRK